MGKELTEKHKLLTPDGCLVAGVRCADGWNRGSIVVGAVKEQIAVRADHGDLT